MRTLSEQLASVWTEAKQAKVAEAKQKASLKFAGLSPAKRQTMRLNVEREVLETIEDLKSTLERINNIATRPDPEKRGLLPRTFALKSGRSKCYSPRKGFEKPYAKLAQEWNDKWKVLQDVKAKLSALGAEEVLK